MPSSPKILYTIGFIRRIKVLRKNNIQILHTRGYNAGLFASKLLKNNKHIKHVFDPRSPYLTEIISTYGVKENDQVYHFWKESEKEEILEIIARLSGKLKSCVCHLDMHFLNIMLPRDREDYVIIDWMNARLAPAVFDYARTYVIFDEFSKEGLEAYKQIVMPELWKTGIKESDFNDAVRVCTIIRKREKNETN